ncbi:site-specific DNA-methyltransferase [uncultured Campylobacter sp.]|uniref:DNA-methyltransferase n=1 Tax=uncultured Campylobacter sp. TaxID=218934 RepID=UPI0026258897|nr:site-specific DNA-methyltransferase [uncultured Campylobacter sp.]
MEINEKFAIDNKVTVFNGDCLELLKTIPDNFCDLIVTSPPYCMGKEYENIHDDIMSFKEQQSKIFNDIYRILKVGGSLCWQVGYHVNKAEIFPLDYYVYQVFYENSLEYKYPLVLRNRIIWTFGHGLNSSKRFSGRHETILWFTKGKEYNFNLDNIRIPQKYPGKRSYKGENKGEFSGNPLGKNPSDVWDIPNVKANHIEKTKHPCQFPIAIPQRLIKALTPINGIVLDPFMGSGTSGVASILEQRCFVGAEIQKEYFNIAKTRIQEAIDGVIKVRKDVPVMEPDLNSSVAMLPEEFRKIREGQA